MSLQRATGSPALHAGDACRDVCMHGVLPLTLACFNDRLSGREAKRMLKAAKAQGIHCLVRSWTLGSCQMSCIDHMQIPLSMWEAACLH